MGDAVMPPAQTREAAYARAKRLKKQQKEAGMKANLQEAREEQERLRVLEEAARAEATRLRNANAEAGARIAELEGQLRARDAAAAGAADTEAGDDDDDDAGDVAAPPATELWKRRPTENGDHDGDWAWDRGSCDIFSMRVIRKQFKQAKHYNAELYVYSMNETVWHLNYIPKMLGHDDDAKTLILAFVGTCVRDLKGSRRRSAWERAQQLFLQFETDTGLVHEDHKRKNACLREDGQVFIFDFENCDVPPGN